MQLRNFLFSLKVLCTPFKKLTPDNTTPLWNQNFLTHRIRFFMKTFLPPFRKMGACHNITKSADSQTNNKSSDNNNITAEFYKTFIKPLSPNDFGLRKQENIRKTSNWVETDASAQSPFYKYIFSNSSQKLHRSRFQGFLVLPNFVWFLYLVSNILSKILDVYSRKEFVTMDASFKTVIISVVYKKRDYI